MDRKIGILCAGDDELAPFLPIGPSRIRRITGRRKTSRGTAAGRLKFPPGDRRPAGGPTGNGIVRRIKYGSFTKYGVRPVRSGGHIGRRSPPAAAVAAGFLESAAQVEIDPMGNVVGRLGKNGAPNRILLNAHLDQISMMVTEIDADGFCGSRPAAGSTAACCPAPL